MTELPVLYGADKKGGYKEWAVCTVNDEVHVTFGKFQGKKQTKITKCKAKNVGRANETTPEEQAISEAKSKWNKQKDKYYRETFEEVDALETEGVMLAQDYTKKPHFLDEEFYVSPKLDGLRVKTVFKDGNPVWESRGNKTYPVPEHLIPELKLLNLQGYDSLDGEAYIHGIKLQKIQSCVKKHNELTHKVTYQIFDVPMLDTDWNNRNMKLTALKEVVNDLKMIDVVPQEFCTKKDLDKKLKSYLSEGFEGAMMRNLHGLYEFQNKRSNDLLKYKIMQDSEAKVLSCRVDKNQEGVLTCSWNGIEFELKMKGDHVYRSYENQCTLIGSWVNFKYQDTTEDGVPTFAVGMYVRECDNEGNPLE